jgi:hypothetical protein
LPSYILSCNSVGQWGRGVVGAVGHWLQVQNISGHEIIVSNLRIQNVYKIIHTVYSDYIFYLHYTCTYIKYISRIHLSIALFKEESFSYGS